MRAPMHRLERTLFNVTLFVCDLDSWQLCLLYAIKLTGRSCGPRNRDRHAPRATKRHPPFSIPIRRGGFILSVHEKTLLTIASKHLTTRIYHGIYWNEPEKEKDFQRGRKYRQAPFGWLLFKKGLGQPLRVSSSTPVFHADKVDRSRQCLRFSPGHVAPSEAYFPLDFSNFSLRSTHLTFPLFLHHDFYVSLFHRSFNFVVDSRRRICPSYESIWANQLQCPLCFPGHGFRYQKLLGFEEFRETSLGNF